MCLGIPGQVVSVEGKTAVTEFWGVRKEIKLDILEEAIQPGDTIVVHAGYAIRRVPPADVADTLATYEVVLCEAGEDPIALDVIEDLEPHSV